MINTIKKRIVSIIGAAAVLMINMPSGLTVVAETYALTGEDVIKTHVGGIEKEYPVKFMEGLGTEFSIDKKVTPNTKATIEIEEIHTRSPEVFAYVIQVNGTDIYFRTYSELSEGPVNYFVEVPAEVVGDNTELSIVFKNETDTRVNFGRIWAYSDFENLLEKEGVSRKMGLGLFQPVLSFANYDSDLEILKKLKEKYNFNSYSVGFGFELLYMKLTKEDMVQRVNWLAKLSADSECPIFLSINSWWGGTPKGPDGQGGFWTDMRYNQVVYDPLDVDGRGKYKLSTPNVWSNTPWLTMNDDHYNAVRKDIISDVMESISKSEALMRISGRGVANINVFTENEPVYWPFYAFNASPDGAGDYNPSVIADAAVDGVVLDPSDGLDEGERLWMAKNLNDYIQTAGDGMKNGLGYNYAVVNNGEIIYPNYQLSENAFSHMFPYPIFPNNAPTQGGWETHLLSQIRFGGEWAKDIDARYLDYIVARGKFANVNSERTSMDDYSVLEQAYLYGADHVTIYNFVAGDEQLVVPHDNLEDRLYTVPSYEKRAFDKFYYDNNSLKLDEELIAFEGVKQEALVERYVITTSKTAAGASMGELIYKVDNNSVPFDTGLAVEINGRILSFLDQRCKVEVFAGSSEDNLSLVETLTSLPAKVDISDVIDTNLDTAYIKIVLHSVDNPGLYSWTAIDRVTAVVPFDKESGQLNASKYSYKQMRARSLWVSYRADVQRMMEEYSAAEGFDESVLREIENDYEQNLYVTAYKKLVVALSSTYPAKFMVNETGQLDKYPIEISTDSSESLLDVTLRSDKHLKAFTANGSKVAGKISFLGLIDGYYVLNSPNNIDFTLNGAVESDPNAVQAVEGKATFNVEFVGGVATNYPSYFKAKHVKVVDNKLYFISHDTESFGYADNTYLPLADEYVVRSGQDGDGENQLIEVPISMLNAGMMLDISLNENNEIVKLDAYSGFVSGEVTAIEQVSIVGEMRNAFVSIKDKNDVLHKFEIGSECELSFSSATGNSILTALIGDIGLSVGDVVSVLYSPYVFTGKDKRALRIFEQSEIIYSQTFESENSAEDFFESENIKIGPLDTNYKNKVLSPENSGKPGFVTWKFDNMENNLGMLVSFSGRYANFFGNEKGSLRWYVSNDNEKWISAADFISDGDKFSDNFTMRPFLVEEVAGFDTIYLKCVIESELETWTSVNDIEIGIMVDPKRKLESLEFESVKKINAASSIIDVNYKAKYDNGDIGNNSLLRVDYLSNNPEIITVRDRKLYAKSNGSTEITMFVTDGIRIIKSEAVLLTVGSPVLDKIVASLASDCVDVGDNAIVSVIANAIGGSTIDPSLLDVKFESSDSEIASIDDSGKITGKKSGKAIISVAGKLGTETATFSLPVYITKSVIVYDNDFEAVELPGLSDPDYEPVPADAVSHEDYDAANRVNDLMKEDLLKADDKAIFHELNTGDIVIMGSYNQENTVNSWPWHNKTELSFIINASEKEKFASLQIKIDARLVSFAGYEAKIDVYAGSDINNLTLLKSIISADIVDLTEMAREKENLIIKLVLPEAPFNWVALNGVKINAKAYEVKEETGNPAKASMSQLEIIETGSVYAGGDNYYTIKVTARDEEQKTVANTDVDFTVSGGYIVGESKTDENGICVVLWKSDAVGTFVIKAEINGEDIVGSTMEKSFIKPSVNVSNGGIFTGEEELVITIDYDHTLFDTVSIGGKTLRNGPDYQVSKGSTILNLRTDYLFELVDGNHVGSAEFSDGMMVEFTFKVSKTIDTTTTKASNSNDTTSTSSSASSTAQPDTSENQSAIFVYVLLCSATIVFFVMLFKKKDDQFN